MGVRQGIDHYMGDALRRQPVEPVADRPGAFLDNCMWYQSNPRIRR